LRSREHREAAGRSCPQEAFGRTEGDPDTDELSSEAYGPSVETIAIRQETNECIREFVGRLPESYRTVMVLGEIEGFKDREIAAIVGLSVDAVKIRLHRVNEMLRLELSRGCCFYRDKERNELACDRKPSK
jgi:RNA polymerase sigma-70 factor (ECF subfamily)